MCIWPKPKAISIYSSCTVGYYNHQNDMCHTCLWLHHVRTSYILAIFNVMHDNRWSRRRSQYAQFVTYGDWVTSLFVVYIHNFFVKMNRLVHVVALNRKSDLPTMHIHHNRNDHEEEFRVKCGCYLWFVSEIVFL